MILAIGILYSLLPDKTVGVIIKQLLLGNVPALLQSDDIKILRFQRMFRLFSASRRQIPKDQ